MATKISGLSAATALDTDDLLEAVEDGVSVKATPPQVVAGSVASSGVLHRSGAATVAPLEYVPWTSVAFDAGNFTASGSMTWTVASGDVLRYAYTILGKSMTVDFLITTSTVGGTPSTELRIAIPASKVANPGTGGITRVPIFVGDNGGAAIGWCQVADGDTNINCRLVNSGNWQASTDQTSVIGQITFEID